MTSPSAGAWRSGAVMTLVSLVGLAAFLWPFLVDPSVASDHSRDAPWLFAVLMGLLALVVLAEAGAGRLEAKTVAVLGVLCAVGGAMRLLSAGVAGLEPTFVVIVLAGRVLGPRLGFIAGALTLVLGGFLTGAIGPWTPFQTIAAGWVGAGAGLLPGRLRGRGEIAALAAYGLVAGLGYGVVMNLWFWPFLGDQAPPGAGFTPGDSVAATLSHYAVFYALTSLGWDLPRGLLTSTLVLVAGRPVLLTLRRAVRLAAFDAPVRFTEDP